MASETELGKLEQDNQFVYRIGLIFKIDFSELDPLRISFKNIVCYAISLCLAAWIFISAPKPVDAQQSIKNNIDISIDLAEETSKVLQTVTVTNTGSSATAISQYNLVLGVESPENLKITRDGSTLSYTSTSSDGSTEILITLGSLILQSNNSATIKISYEDDSIVFIKGDRHIVMIPKLSVDNTINSVSMEISAPVHWEDVNYASVGYQRSINDDKQTLGLNEDDILENDIVLTFGKFQNYNMVLKYQLQNTSTKQQFKKIVVPPNQRGQYVIWDSISEPPDYAYMDNDGNYILSYSLSPDEERIVIFRLLIQREYKEPNANTNVLTASEKQEYTKSDVFWGTSDPEIVTIANSLTAGKKSNLEKSLSILEYVNSKLYYSEDKVLDQAVERKGGIGSLNNPMNSICQDYVDLYITLARSGGIPARAIAGFAFPDTDLVASLPTGVLHSWVEIWDDSYGWIEIDPTWEDTAGIPFHKEIGIGHIRWATYGESSTGPELPVAYNLLPNQQGLNATVTFSALDISPDPDFTIETTETNHVIQATSLSNTKIPLMAENTGNVVIENLGLALAETSLFKATLSQYTAQNDEEFPIILTPFQTLDIDMLLSDVSVLTFNFYNEPIRIKISGDFVGEEITDEVTTNLTIQNSRIIYVAIWIGIGLILTAVAVGVYFVRKYLHKRYNLQPRKHNILDRKKLG